MSKIASDIESIIHWSDESTQIDITLHHRRAGIDSITIAEGCLGISFLNGTGLSIDIPTNPDNLLKVIERDLLRWNFYENHL